jgi:hypothetical protein
MESVPRVNDAVLRLKAVFLEMPGTRLTPADAARLSGLDAPLCQLILYTLEETDFLKRGQDGLYMRRTLDSPRS